MRLLIVEDNEAVSRLLAEVLVAAGCLVDVTETAASACAALARMHFDAVILDLGLPDADGLSVVRELRQRKDSTPVLVLTARCGVRHRVEALRSGADDYLEKPFDFEELVARVKALLRRPGDLIGAPLQLGNIILDTAARQIFIAGQAQVFSAREVVVLEILMRCRGQIIAGSTIEHLIFGPSTTFGSSAVRVYMHRVRKLLAQYGADVQIRTVPGRGYLMLEEK